MTYTVKVTVEVEVAAADELQAIERAQFQVRHGHCYVYKTWPEFVEASCDGWHETAEDNSAGTGAMTNEQLWEHNRKLDPV